MGAEEGVELLRPLLASQVHGFDALGAEGDAQHIGEAGECELREQKVVEGLAVGEGGGECVD